MYTNLKATLRDLLDDGASVEEIIEMFDSAIAEAEAEKIYSDSIGEWIDETSDEICCYYKDGAEVPTIDIAIKSMILAIVAEHRETVSMDDIEMLENHFEQDLDIINSIVGKDPGEIVGRLGDNNRNSNKVCGSPDYPIGKPSCNCSCESDKAKINSFFKKMGL